MSLKIYVAGTWKNAAQPYLVVDLRRMGYLVYDFKTSLEVPVGFPLPEKYRMLTILQLLFDRRREDMDIVARDWCDVCVVPPPTEEATGIPRDAGIMEKTGKPVIFHMWPARIGSRRTTTVDLAQLKAALDWLPRTTKP